MSLIYPKIQSKITTGLDTTSPKKIDPDYIAITIAYNEEKYIRDTIESVLNQTIKPRLYIVVDDGSTDRTQFIVSEYPVYYMRVDEPKFHLGSMNMHRALVRGIKQATDLVPDWDFMLKSMRIA